MKRLLVLVLAVCVAFLPSTALAAEGDDESVIIRISGDVVVPSGETIGAVIVIDGNARIEGTVSGGVFVIDGDADVSGTIEEELTVISGDISLRAGSSVHNVTSIRGDLNRANGATVTGEIHERDNFGFLRGVAAVFSVLFWLAMTVAVIVAGLVFAAVGGRQLTEAARTMTGDAVNTIMGIVFVWVALPLLAVLAMVTLIGLPLGIGVLLFLMPALWFLGFIVAGCRLGNLVVRSTGREVGAHPYLATFVGLILLQLAILVPFAGILVAGIGGLWGGGALAFTAFRAAGGKGFTPPAERPREQPQPAA